MTTTLTAPLATAAPLTMADLSAKVSGSSFYAGMRILPRPEREAMFAIYGFCRIVDDIADDQTAPRDRRGAMLDDWARWIGALYRGGDTGQAAFLAEAVRRFDLQEADFQEVIAGMRMDVDADICWPDFATLDLYCDRVASAVGRLSVNVFGMERAVGVDLAHHLGRALQFTNILRDIDEDAGIDRVYLPIEALRLAGITPTTPAALLGEAGVYTAARWLAAKAQAHFRAAGAILRARPRGHLVAPRLMEAAYAPVLERMIAAGWHAPRHRIRVSKLALLGMALRLWLFR
ncbi:presqualene diphosphate synthase HpnD [Novosphingobium sp. FSY-8]|uniref:Presqualene diphosphate synthase HpnD n=1 Tax=Novosphingobium ovatum TaxID=1908523 RepID=A0ABW9XH21_9SPHN|nr:presqualene diphosphate synthase HpnD [Novosphingobium ovatum]NBC37848.1 presqualene diphosphate synthase HpnD [Novosphingobium ovatum]